MATSRINLRSEVNSLRKQGEAELAEAIDQLGRDEATRREAQKQVEATATRKTRAERRLSPIRKTEALLDRLEDADVSVQRAEEEATATKGATAAAALKHARVESNVVSLMTLLSSFREVGDVHDDPAVAAAVASVEAEAQEAQQLVPDAERQYDEAMSAAEAAERDMRAAIKSRDQVFAELCNVMSRFRQRNDSLSTSFSDV